MKLSKLPEYVGSEFFFKPAFFFNSTNLDPDSGKQLFPIKKALSTFLDLTGLVGGTGYELEKYY